MVLRICETKNNVWKRHILSIQNSIDNHIKTTRIKPNFASLNNGLKCRKPVFMRVSGICFIKWLQFGSIYGESNVSSLQSRCRQLYQRTQNEYQRRYVVFTERYNTIKVDYDKISEQIESKKAQRELFKGFIRALEKQGALVEEFYEGLWGSLVQ